MWVNILYTEHLGFHTLSARKKPDPLRDRWLFWLFWLLEGKNTAIKKNILIYFCCWGGNRGSCLGESMTYMDVGGIYDWFWPITQVVLFFFNLKLEALEVQFVLGNACRKNCEGVLIQAKWPLGNPGCPELYQGWNTTLPKNSWLVNQPPPPKKTSQSKKALWSGLMKTIGFP